MSNCKTYNFDIADFNIKILFNNTSLDSINLIPSFKVFLTCEMEEKPLLFKLFVVSELQEYTTDLEHIRTFDTGNGDIKVDKTIKGYYIFEIKDLNNDTCCKFISNNDFSECSCKLYGNRVMRSFGLNNAFNADICLCRQLKKHIINPRFSRKT